MRNSEYTANQLLAEMLQRFENLETFRKDFAAEEILERMEREERERAATMNRLLDALFGERVK